MPETGRSPSPEKRPYQQDLAAQILALHKPWYEVNGVRHDHLVGVVTEDLSEGHVCRTEGDEQCRPEWDEHYDLACEECRQVVEDTTGYLLWPCPTARLAMQAAALDPSEAALIAAEMLLNAHGFVAVERPSGEARATTLALLEDHIFDKGLAQCRCGAELGGRGHRTRAHREHLADLLHPAGRGSSQVSESASTPSPTEEAG